MGLLSKLIEEEEYARMQRKTAEAYLRILDAFEQDLEGES